MVPYKLKSFYKVKYDEWVNIYLGDNSDLVVLFLPFVKSVYHIWIVYKPFPFII